METKDTAGIIERLEAASVPDRELDARIWLIVGNELGSEYSIRGRDPLRPNEISNGRHMASAMEKYPDDIGGICRSWRVPQLTYSIDAALSLVPEGYSYELTKSAAGEFSRARLWDWKRGPLAFDPDNNWVSEGNRSLAINLVIAALRARAQGE